MKLSNWPRWILTRENIHKLKSWIVRDRKCLELYKLWSAEIFETLQLWRILRAKEFETFQTFQLVTTKLQLANNFSDFQNFQLVTTNFSNFTNLWNFSGWFAEKVHSGKTISNWFNFIIFKLRSSFSVCQLRFAENRTSPNFEDWNFQPRTLFIKWHFSVVATKKFESR